MSVQTKLRFEKRSVPNSSKNPFKGLLGAVLPYPEQPLAFGVYLVGQRQKLGTCLLPTDFVDTDGGHTPQLAMGKPPGDGHLD